MLCFSQHLKVRRIVVARVLIDVMHDLFTCEESPQFALHNQTMLHHVPLGIGVRMMRREQRKVSIPTPVGNFPLESWMGITADMNALPFGFTSDGTELARTPSRSSQVLSAVEACDQGRIAPPVGKVTGIGAELRNRFAPVLRVKVGTTSLALEGDCCSFHVLIIHHVTRYCEIAVKRLQQAVLPMEVPA